MIVLGVDPGAKSVGYCVLDVSGGTDHPVVLHHQVDSLPKAEFPASTEWVVKACTTARDLTFRFDAQVLALEKINSPKWHSGGRARPIAPTFLLATAQVLGALQTLDTLEVPVELVSPGKLGSAPMRFYPEALVSPGERRRVGWEDRVGTSELRHARSAYDIARHGAITAFARRRIAMKGSR